MHISKLITGKKSLFIGIAGLVAVIAILEVTNTTHIFHKQKVPPVIPAHTNSGQPIIGSNSSTTNSTSPTSPQDNTPLPADVTSHTLITPSGTFVSNHSPGQNETSTSEVSTCVTSPGAACYIKFTNTTSGEATQLAPQVTDARGSTTWYWDTSQDAHLTTGQWKITAVATLGDQTKSAGDALNLTIR